MQSLLTDAQDAIKVLFEEIYRSFDVIVTSNSTLHKATDELSSNGLNHKITKIDDVNNSNSCKDVNDVIIREFDSSDYDLSALN